MLAIIIHIDDRIMESLQLPQLGSEFIGTRFVEGDASEKDTLRLGEF